jgi:hypothetical protein
VRPNSTDGGQFGCFGREFLGWLDVLFDEQIEVFDLLFELAD